MLAGDRMNIPTVLSAPESVRDAIGRVAALLLTIAVISSLHYLTDPSRIVLHEVYQYACYAPIVVAAYWFGPLGGLLTATVASIVFIPHIQMTWGGNAPYRVSQYGQIVVFHLLGVGVGLLASAQRRLTDRYRELAQSLDVRNRELKESQAHLVRADRLSVLGQIASGLAHEIRNPLAGVKGALDIIAARAQPGSPEEEFTAVARRELARLDGLVTEFLTYARPHDPELRLASFDEVVAHVMTLLGTEAERARVRLVTAVPTDLSPVWMDPEQIAQVLLNVVLNGIQATPPAGQVQVSARTSDGYLCIDVVDEGPGIPPELAARIFDPFFTTKPRGTGLGLAISGRIVAAHRGTIDVRPPDPRGGRIRITLPLAAAGDPPRARKA